MPVSTAGCSAADKVKRLQHCLSSSGADAIVVSALDDVAWLTNMRGGDINYNPVFFSFAVLTPTSASLYIRKQQQSQEVIEHATSSGFELKDYSEVHSDVQRLASLGNTFTLDPNKNNWATSETIVTSGGKLRIEPSPVTIMKAVKNEVELQGCAAAHVTDALALVKFLRWLEEAVAAGEQLTEVSVSDHLLRFRQLHAAFVTPSFATIAGFASNGAVIHYHPQEGGNNKRVDSSDMFLLDSGGQYLNGTTDVTRTLHMGCASDHHKRCYTRVLQSHLQLHNVVFPKGITGFQLDVIARTPLWKDGLEYAHGTGVCHPSPDLKTNILCVYVSLSGHGVGHYLCVHEGPHGISHVQRSPDVALQAGMLVTVEPGYYEPGAFGIRIENVAQVRGGV